eukprot:jgi/Hompol1/1252/HPOL_000520-RA
MQHIIIPPPTSDSMIDRTQQFLALASPFVTIPTFMIAFYAIATRHDIYPWIVDNSSRPEPYLFALSLAIVASCILGIREGISNWDSANAHAFDTALTVADIKGRLISTDVISARLLLTLCAFLATLILKIKWGFLDTLVYSQ